MSRKDITDAEVCAAILCAKEDGWRNGYAYELLAKATGEPEKVCYAAMERAESRGLVECGVSLRTGWLTDKGHAFLDGSLRLCYGLALKTK